jgi:sugar transferase (PEP-CTERM system associated)
MTILGHRLPPLILFAFAFEGCLVVLAFLLAGFVRVGVDMEVVQTALEGRFWQHAAALTAVMLTALTSVGLYQPRQRFQVFDVAGRIVIACGLAFVGLSVLFFAVPYLEIGRGVLLMTLLITAILISVERAVLYRLLDEELFRGRVLVYGAGNRAAQLQHLRRKSDRRGFIVVGYVKTPNDSSTIQGVSLVHLDKPLLDVADELKIDEVVVALDDRRGHFPIKDLLDCKLAGIRVTDLVTFLERETGRVHVEIMEPSWIIFSEGFTRHLGRRVATRALDLICGFAVLAVAWPLMLLTTVAIVLDSGLPVLYRQTRVGFRGQPFTLVKFRSMMRDAEADGPRWASKADERSTRVGRIIRKYRLDELPQLWNVIAGHMSFVGPRPERPEFVTRLTTSIPYYYERHAVKPGLTGWAQLCFPYGSSEADTLKKLQFDLYYVKNQSLLFDLMILLQTVEVVLWQKGSR